MSLLPPPGYYDGPLPPPGTGALLPNASQASGTSASANPAAKVSGTQAAATPPQADPAVAAGTVSPSDLREPGWGDAFWKAGKELSTHHKANLTGSSLHSAEGLLGVVATGALGDNLAKKVPVLPFVPFLDEWSQWGAALDKTQQLEQEVTAADGTVQKQSAADYLQLRDGKLSGKLNDHQNGLMQASGNLDFTQRSIGSTLVSTDGQSLSSTVDVDDQRFNAAYNGGQGKIQLGTGVDLKKQQLDGSITSTDGQTLSAHSDLNDGVLGLGYQGGPQGISTQAEVNRENRSLSAQAANAQATHSHNQLSTGSSLSVADGLQSDSFAALTHLDDAGQAVEDKTRLRLGRRVGVGFDHTISSPAVPGQDKAPDKGWNAGVYHDRQSGRNEISGGLKNSLQAGFAAGGDEGTTVNLSLGQRLVGKELQSASAQLSLKPGEIEADLGIGKHKSHLKLNGSGVEADLSIPLGPGAKAPSIGGGVKFSRVENVLSERLQELKGPDGSCSELRTVTVSDDNLWGVNAKYVDPSGIAGKFSVEKTLKQDLSFTASASQLAAVPDSSALDTRISDLETEANDLKHTEANQKKKLGELRAERKKIAEKQEQPRLTAEARQKKLKQLDQQILAQQKQVAEVMTPQAQSARNSRLIAIGTELKQLNTEREPVDAARAALATEIDSKAASLLNPAQAEQSLAAAAALAPGEKLELKRERELGWTLEAGVQTAATGSFGRTGTAHLNLALEGLGQGKVRVQIHRAFERDLSIKGDAAGMARLERLGEKDNSRSYALELDLNTPAGKAAYLALLGPVNQLGTPLPEFKAATGVSLTAESAKQRVASDLNRDLNLAGVVHLSDDGKLDFTQRFDQLARSSQYLGLASRTQLQDSKDLPVIGKLFAHEETLTGANYELRSNGDQSFTLSLQLQDESVRHGEASSYGLFYQQSLGKTSVSAAPRKVVKTYNDHSSLNLNLELRLDAGNIQTIVGASREQLLAAARQTEGISYRQARFFARRLEKAENAAALEADQQGLQSEQHTAHVQAARLHCLLAFIESNGEAVVPFLQQLTGGCINVCQSSLERGGYLAQSHMSSARLAELTQQRQHAGGEGVVDHKLAKSAESWQQELKAAQTSLQLSQAALAQDPLIAPQQKAQHQQELTTHLQAVSAELTALAASGLLSEHSSLIADQQVSPAQLQTWQQQAQTLKSKPDAHALNLLQAAIQTACEQLDTAIGEAQSNRELPPARRVVLIQALLDRRLELEALLR